MGRQRHPKKELEAVLQMVEARGWRADRRNGYFKIYCACGNHQRTVALTPSGAQYRLNLIKWLERQDCWEEGSK